MSLEKSPNLLNKDEAHDMANMMNVKLGVDPESGLIKEKGEKPTAEDYDKALELVEEMKKMVEEESSAEKISSELARLATKSGYNILKGLTFFSTLGDKFIAIDGIDNDKKEALKKFADAASELQKLKAEAEEFGKRANLAQKK